MLNLTKYKRIKSEDIGAANPEVIEEATECKIKGFRLTLDFYNIYDIIADNAIILAHLENTDLVEYYSTIKKKIHGHDDHIAIRVGHLGLALFRVCYAHYKICGKPPRDRLGAYLIAKAIHHS